MQRSIRSLQVMVTELRKEYVNDGDTGCGKPGDSQWHLCVIAQISDEKIPEYIRKVFDVEISGDDVRAQALELIWRTDLK